MNEGTLIASHPSSQANSLPVVMSKLLSTKDAESPDIDIFKAIYPDFPQSIFFVIEFFFHNDSLLTHDSITTHLVIL